MKKKLTKFFMGRKCKKIIIKDLKNSAKKKLILLLKKF